MYYCKSRDGRGDYETSGIVSALSWLREAGGGWLWALVSDDEDDDGVRRSYDVPGDGARECTLDEAREAAGPSGAVWVLVADYRVRTELDQETAL